MAQKKNYSTSFIQDGLGCRESFFFFEPKVLWYKYGQMKMTTNTVTKVNYKRCHYSKIVFNTQYIPSSGMFIPNSFTHCPILTELKLDGLSRLGNSVVTSSFFFFCGLIPIFIAFVVLHHRIKRFKQRYFFCS